MSDKKMENILNCNNIKSPVVGRCGFFVKRKQRYCKMLPSKGNMFCAEHFSEEKDEVMKNQQRERIVCPLDQKHTVYADQLKKHMKKCNATIKKQLPFYSEDINIGLLEFEYKEEENTCLSSVNIDEIKELIARVEIFNNNLSVNEDIEITYHPVLEEEMKRNPQYGDSVKKHLKQQGSLINILSNLESLVSDMSFIEFGAGRGALSHWIQKAVDVQVNNMYYLVDRQHNRNKFDCYHKGIDQGPNFQRLNIDIQHLNLEKVDSIVDSLNRICAVGKHLCGGATDLSLRCLFESKTSSRHSTTSSPPVKRSCNHSSSIKSSLHSCVFALCCYHRCTWQTYVGRDYMTKHNFSPLQFLRITKMAGWATCGFQRRDDNNFSDVIDDTNEGEHGKNEHEDRDINKEKLHISLGLSTEQQIEIGRKCKRLIDQGRIEYINCHGYKGKLVKYIDSNITPENIALVITTASST